MALAGKFLLNSKLTSTRQENTPDPDQFRRLRFSELTSNTAKNNPWVSGTKFINGEERERARTKLDVHEQNKSKRLRVAYQGVPGAYSEVAAKLACVNCSTVSCQSIVDAIEAVETGQADHAVMPVESTLEGTKVRNYDLLLKRDLYITQEINMFVHYCLLAIPGVRKEGVKKVISHPVALAHCNQGLSRVGLDASQEPVNDTAGAVELLLEQNMLDTAAIASKQAAKLYGLQVLAEGLQNEPWNVTRFLILSKKPETERQKENRKTSMVIGHRGGLQPLLRVLSAFSSRNISLAKLEVNNSRKPIRILDATAVGGFIREFQHVFYVDFEHSTDDQKVSDAVAEISVFSPFIRILGCYNADTKIYYV